MSTDAGNSGLEPLPLALKECLSIDLEVDARTARINALAAWRPDTGEQITTRSGALEAREASKLDRMARSVPDACAIADRLQEQGVKLALGRALHDSSDPMGKMFFNILATFAEFEADLIRMRTREGMALTRSKGKLRGKQPKLSDRQQRELCRMHATGEYSISDLAELFSISRPTVYRTLKRHVSPWPALH